MVGNRGEFTQVTDSRPGSSFNPNFGIRFQSVFIYQFTNLFSGVGSVRFSITSYYVVACHGGKLVQERGIIQLKFKGGYGRL